jgi:hypothetical protein
MLRIPGVVSPLRHYPAKRMTVAMPLMPFDRYLKSVAEAPDPPLVGMAVLVFRELLLSPTSALPLLDSIAILIYTHPIIRTTLPPP